MSKTRLENLVTLTLELDDLGWLRAHLKEEIFNAEVDHEEVERLHTDVAIHAAKTALSQETDRMTKIVDALDIAITSDDARAAFERQIAAMTPPVA